MTTLISGTSGVNAPAKEQISGAISTVRVSGSNGYGSINTVIRRFSTVSVNQGSDISYADSATLGASFTVNTPGVYAISYVDSASVASDFGISLNSSQLTTGVGSISPPSLLSIDTAGGASQRANTCVILPLAVGDVIRPHTLGQAAGGTPLQTIFTMTRVG